MTVWAEPWLVYLIVGLVVLAAIVALFSPEEEQ